MRLPSQLLPQRVSIVFAGLLTGAAALDAAGLSNTLVNNPASDLTAQDNQSNAALVLGSGSTLVAVFHDSGSFVNPGGNQIDGYARSTDGGVTWTDLGKLPGSMGGDAGNPVLARDASADIIYLCTLGFSGGVQVFRSANDGATFAAPILGSPGFGFGVDRPWIAVDGAVGACNGTVYLAFTSFNVPQGIHLSRSTDDGSTWSAPSSLGAGASSNGANVAVGADHALYVSWYDPSFDPRRIQMKKSTDCGVTFSAAATVTTLAGTGVQGGLGLPFRTNSFPKVATNPSDANRIYVAYNDDVAGADRGNIFFRQSTDGGSTWSSAVQVNTDATTATQFHPALAVRPDGTGLALTWYDRRLDAADELMARWSRAATISGGTVSFGPDYRISPQFAPHFGVDPLFVATYMDDYDQMAADNAFFYSVWGDFRDEATFPGADRKNSNVRFAKFGIAGPGYDVDRNDVVGALTDAVVIVRRLFAFSGGALVAAAIGAGAQQTDPGEVAAQIDSIRDFMLDLDDDGEEQPLTDGLLLLRYLFGFRDDPLIAGALGPDCDRCLADDIEEFIQDNLPPP
jgi:hypothetical protein